MALNRSADVCLDCKDEMNQFRNCDICPRCKFCLGECPQCHTRTRHIIWWTEQKEYWYNPPIGKIANIQNIRLIFFCNNCSFLFRSNE